MFPVPNLSVAVIEGPRVFNLFLDLSDVFYLSRVANVRLPGGIADFWRCALAGAGGLALRART